MGNIGISQWLIILVIIVLLFGAKKIPELAKGVGKGIKSFKAEMEEPVEKVEKKEETVKNSEETKTV
ncbi:Sec-independent protein translocase subunit TatA/TatB [Campylobacter pinnipediorum]|uniref:Sec-independent protein translocase protein TatA n=2 Tax=Campylobacter pinnipediorum TaxID=1965231 RepID=A0A1S6U6M1_9BACT|nr:twin-arginine translocase TatA/TatE family subunit [Campylobacter pinnipediorum]AQW80851.1 twin arginine translocation system, TatA/E family protein [Campylobacter pinnipediorum subsp. pinnipediorum]AQW82470.1 twin arginine translocation system, TatA/E family protein [Campylobacter pinnipediorum subsp. pinnipediorum]AQW84140.1 twin arginine translocation system, TatA/E family protein [Campylobacter pinnipediorum subsp. pinnipediorum]AQW85780.1 twin arginine translocation system, TatA/E famil